jgi:hypothetical protein
MKKSCTKRGDFILYFYGSLFRICLQIEDKSLWGCGQLFTEVSSVPINIGLMDVVGVQTNSTYRSLLKDQKGKIS